MVNDRNGYTLVSRPRHAIHGFTGACFMGLFGGVDGALASHGLQPPVEGELAANQGVGERRSGNGAWISGVGFSAVVAACNFDCPEITAGDVRPLVRRRFSGPCYLSFWGAPGGGAAALRC
jgi:hypothetical protein